jgi:hypothetical protein
LLAPPFRFMSPSQAHAHPQYVGGQALRGAAALVATRATLMCLQGTPSRMTLALTTSSPYTSTSLTFSAPSTPTRRAHFQGRGQRAPSSFSTAIPTCWRPCSLCTDPFSSLVRRPPAGHATAANSVRPRHQSMACHNLHRHALTWCSQQECDPRCVWDPVHAPSMLYLPHMRGFREPIKLSHPASRRGVQQQSDCCRFSAERLTGCACAVTVVGSSKQNGF